MYNLIKLMSSIKPFNKSSLEGTINLTPKTSNDIINIPFKNWKLDNSSRLLDVSNFTPLTDNDIISKFSLRDFIPLSIAGMINMGKFKLSEGNKDDISKISPFMDGHFFDFGQNFTRKWSYEKNLGINEQFGNIGDSELVGEDGKVKKTDMHAIFLKSEHGGPVSNTGTVGKVELNIHTLEDGEYNMDR